MRRPPTHGRDSGHDPVPIWHTRRPVPTTSGSASLVGVLLVLATAALVMLHGLALATGGSAATRTLAAILPALTDLDQALQVHGDAVRVAASDDGFVPVPGLPLPVAVPAQAAQTGGEALRHEAIAAMTRAVYRSGSGALQAEEAVARSTTPLTRSWLLDQALNLLTRSMHAHLALWRVPAVAAVTILAALLAMTTGWRRASVAVGSAVAAGALVATVVAALGWGAVLVLLSGSGDVTEAVLGRVTRDVAMMVIGTGLIVAVAATLMAAVGTLPRGGGRAASANLASPRLDGQ